MRLYFVLLIFTLVITPVQGGSLEGEIQKTLTEVDQAEDDGANVEDLYHRIELVVEQLDSCGWEGCDGEIIANQREELVSIRSEARNRQRMDWGWLLLTAIMVGVVIVYKRYDQLRRVIQWWILSSRKIDYTDGEDLNE